MVRAGLSAEHGKETVDQMSAYYMALEISQTQAGMLIEVPDECWVGYSRLTGSKMAAEVKAIATYVDPNRYRKSKRGPKRSSPTAASIQTAATSQRTSCYKRGRNDTLEALPRWGPVGVRMNRSLVPRVRPRRATLG